jgi:NAD(P)-dependent dehydrogenase (short-subunit alcohol dehydrogenase family)
MRLKDKVAVITGAGRGIGQAVAFRFSQEGASLVICDINQQDLGATRDKIIAKGGQVLAQVVDVSDLTAVKKLVNTAETTFGTIDILVNNAGITRDVMLHKMTENDWDTVMGVNLKGCFNCTSAVMPLMRDKGYGKIVNVSSVSRFGNVGQANYAASKAGVVGFTRAVAKEAGGKGITINAVAPGSIMTDMFMAIPENIRELAKFITPLKRAGTADEVAAVCLFLASDESSYITGQVIQCDGGMYMP